jgi:hypothetical protein
MSFSIAGVGKLIDCVTAVCVKVEVRHNHQTTTNTPQKILPLL